MCCVLSFPGTIACPDPPPGTCTRQNTSFAPLPHATAPPHPASPSTSSSRSFSSPLPPPLPPPPALPRSSAAAARSACGWRHTPAPARPPRLQGGEGRGGGGGGLARRVSVVIATLGGWPTCISTAAAALPCRWGGLPAACRCLGGLGRGHRHCDVHVVTPAVTGSLPAALHCTRPLTDGLCQRILSDDTDLHLVLVLALPFAHLLQRRTHTGRRQDREAAPHPLGTAGAVRGGVGTRRRRLHRAAPGCHRSVVRAHLARHLELCVHFLEADLSVGHQPAQLPHLPLQLPHPLLELWAAGERKGEGGRGGRRVRGARAGGVTPAPGAAPAWCTVCCRSWLLLPRATAWATAVLPAGQAGAAACRHGTDPGSHMQAATVVGTGQTCTICSSYASRSFRCSWDACALQTAPTYSARPATSSCMMLFRRSCPGDALRGGGPAVQGARPGVSGAAEAKGRRGGGFRGGGGAPGLPDGAAGPGLQAGGVTTPFLLELSCLGEASACCLLGVACTSCSRQWRCKRRSTRLAWRSIHRCGLPNSRLRCGRVCWPCCSMH